MVAKERQVLALVVKRRLEEGADDDLAELALLLRRDEAAEVEKARAAWAGVGAPPHRVPLAVVGAVDVPRGFEPRLAVGELHPLPLPQPGERRDVAIMRAVDDEIIHVLHRREL